MARKNTAPPGPLLKLTKLAFLADVSVDTIILAIDAKKLPATILESGERRAYLRDVRAWIADRCQRKAPTDSVTLEDARRSLPGIGPLKFQREFVESLALQTFEVAGVKMTSRHFLVAAIALIGDGTL